MGFNLPLSKNYWLNAGSLTLRTNREQMRQRAKKRIRGPKPNEVSVLKEVSSSRARSTMSPKPQRVRDPLHNLIEFWTDQFEHVMWQVVQTSSFQRLRRIKQLGFSELVYPGATHSRLGWSLFDLFHVGGIIRKSIDPARPVRKICNSNWRC